MYVSNKLVAKLQVCRLIILGVHCCHAGDSSDLTLAFEDVQIIPICSRDTDNAEDVVDTDDTDKTNETDDTDDTDDIDDAGDFLRAFKIILVGYSFDNFGILLRFFLDTFCIFLGYFLDTFFYSIFRYFWDTFKIVWFTFGILLGYF